MYCINREEFFRCFDFCNFYCVSKGLGVLSLFVFTMCIQAVRL